MSSNDGQPPLTRPTTTTRGIMSDRWQWRRRTPCD